MNAPPSGQQSSAPSIRCIHPGPHQPEFDDLPHVLLVVDCFPKTLGGGERIVLRLASLLPRYGFRASILTFSIDAESSFRPSEAPCPLYLLPLGRTYDARALRAALTFRRFLKDQKIRIVQTFFESSDLWAGTVARTLASVRLIWSRRDLGILRGRKHTLAYRVLRRLPHAVFAVSDEVRRHAVEVDRIPADRVHTIHNGLDLRALPPDTGAGRGGPAPTIVTVGNIRRVKGHDVLVHAASRIVRQFPTATFEVAGEVLDQDYFNELRTLIRDLGLEDRFRFAGGVQQLGPWLQRAHVFVLPSRSEGFSNALIEAMAAGLPVVATRVGGNAEAVEDEVSGRIVPPEDPEALAEAILRLLSSPDDARRIGEAGRQRVKDQFTVDAMMQKVVASYSEVLGW